MYGKQPDGEQAWYQPGKWWVSPWNYQPELTESFNLPADGKILVVDSTLRSICTSEPGTAVTPGDLAEIALELDAIGVKEAVFNISHTGSISDLAFRGAQASLKAGLNNLLITSGCSLLPMEWRTGLDKAIEAGVNRLEVSYGAFPLEGFSGTPQVFDLLDEAVTYARDQGFQPSVAFNVHRETELDFLLEYMRLAATYEPRFIRLYDTKTCLSPEGMRWLVQTIRSHLGEAAPPIVIHTHNSWGLASATTIAGVLAGARGIDVAVLALGTKSGHTPFEETVLALEALYGLDTGIDLTRLDRLCKLVARVTDKPIHSNKAVVGDNAYLCEQGPSVVEAIRERMTGVPALTPFANVLVGQKKRVVWGKNTLKAPVVKMKFKELGIEASDDQVRQGLEALKTELNKLSSYPAWLEDEQAEAILRRLAS